MNPATQQVIALIVLRVANPNSSSVSLSSPEGPKSFSVSYADLSYVDLTDYETKLRYTGSGNSTGYFSEIKSDQEGFELAIKNIDVKDDKDNALVFEGRISGGDSFKGSVTGNKATFNSPSYKEYRLG